MKRICCLLSCLLSVVICCTILISCSSVTTNEELTEAEKKFAGEWELEDITYFTSNYNPTTEQFERFNYGIHLLQAHLIVCASNIYIKQRYHLTIIKLKAEYLQN